MKKYEICYFAKEFATPKGGSRGFDGLIFLWFGKIPNQVMQNTIPKLYQTSIISKKPSFFVWKIENFDEVQLPQKLIFLAEILYTFST